MTKPVSKPRSKPSHKLIQYNAKRLPWSKIKNNIIKVEHAIFGSRSYAQSILEADFTDPNATIVLVCSQSGRISGFAYAKKGSKYNLYKRSVAELESIALLPSLRGQNWGGRMLKKLETILLAKGVKTLEMDAKICNGFAKRVEDYNRSHGRPILRSYTHDSPWGKQKFLRFRIT